MGDASASAAANSTSGLQANDSGNVNPAQTSYTWLYVSIGGVIVLFALAIWAKKLRKQ